MTSHVTECIMAQAVARVAHYGQRDKGGESYIEHPRRVSAAVPIDCAAAALLHDVVEDTPVTLAHLEAAGFTPRTLAAVDALTRRDGETYRAYIERCVANPTARVVKVADLDDNSDPRRVAAAEANGWKDARGMVKRYDEARVYIRTGEWPKGRRAKG